MSSETRWYVYRQNNSGGGFQHYPECGIGLHVAVEAKSAKQADALASSIGLYFDGVGDCSCCGTRWSEKATWYRNDDVVDGYDVTNDLSTVRSPHDKMWNTPSYAHPLTGAFYKL